MASACQSSLDNVVARDQRHLIGSGLGLEAQKQALERFAEAEGFTLAGALLDIIY
jgi:hypothetical protein